MITAPTSAGPPEVAQRRPAVFTDLGLTVVAHRGSGTGTGPAGTRENSLAAFRWAADQGAPWVELDVPASRDSGLVVRHDLRDDTGYVSAADAVDWTARDLLTLERLHDELPSHVGIDVEVDAVLRNHPAEAPAEDVLAVARRFGVQVLVWGAVPAQVPALADLGVDAVCVDAVVETLQVLGQAVRPT